MNATPTGLRLLLVEDEMMVAMMVEDLLSDLGYMVVEVAGTLARGLAAAANPDLALDGAILDVNLGGDKVYPVAEALAARGTPLHLRHRLWDRRHRAELRPHPGAR